MGKTKARPAAGRFDTITRYANLAGTQLVAQTDYTYDDASRLTALTHSKGQTTLAGYTASTARGPKGVTLYVSKGGDNTDGRSWKTAFHTIQQALSAVPDARGGHRIVVRPDKYMEANLYPARKGAKGAYNELVGDVDGSLGSGAAGDRAPRAMAARVVRTHRTTRSTIQKGPTLILREHRDRPRLPEARGA